MKKRRFRIPKNLQGLLWSKDVKEIDPEKDRVYLIHQILRYGSLEDIRWLLRRYPRETVKRVFLGSPLPIYSRPALNFVKNYLLDLKKVTLDPKVYVKALS